MTRTVFLVPVVTTLCLCHTTTAQPIRAYPDPGYRHLGVYARGPESYFDYHLVKLRLGDSFPNKREYWAKLKASRAEQTGSHRHDVFLVYAGERTDRLEVVTARVDAWLQAEPDVPTFPELIPAVCLGEENVSGRKPVLDGLARHIRARYRIPVLQWYSDPLPPDPDLTADGWIWDSYGREDVHFRKHVMKFVVFGKPALCVPWATDPHWRGWKQSLTTEAMLNREWHQFRTCMEFDVSCAVFAVAGPGALNPWLSSQSPEMVKLRNHLRMKRAQMHSFRPGDLPLPSADFSARDRSVAVGGDPDAPSVFVEDFSGFAWIHEANLHGFGNLKLTSRPDEPGFLLAKTVAGQAVQASLVYRFESYFPLQRVQVTLDAAAPTATRCRNEIAISTDQLGESWPLTAVQTGRDAVEPLVLRDEGQLKDARVFYLRVRLSNHADKAAQPANRLDRLRVECVHRPPPAGTDAELVADCYGNLSYEDDFSTARWRHLGSLDIHHPDHGGQRDGQIWVGRVGGYATQAHLLQRFSSPQPLKELAVTIDCRADEKNLASRVALQIAPRGQKPQWEIGTQGRHQGPLRLEVPAEELHGLKDFDAHVVLHSRSGVEGGDQACARLERLAVQAQ